MRHNGQRSASPFVRLASLTMHRLSFHADGDIVLADDAKAAIGKMTPEQFKAALPDFYTKVGETAVNEFKSGLPKVPEKYEVKLPEGSVLAAATLERVAPAARALGLTSNEQAQQIVNLVSAEAKALAERFAADFAPGGSAFEAQRQQYTAAALAAPDLGNGSAETLQAKVALVTTLTNKYFPDDVRELINKTGIGNHPNFFRALFKIAVGLKEDGFVSGPGPAVVKKSAADRIYG